MNESEKFNMNDWKNFYSNNHSEESYQWLCEHYSSNQCLFLGTFQDKLPVIDFMKTNLINGFYQALDNKLHRNTFGTGLLKDKILTFVFLFDGIEMPELFKDSSLYEACIWTKIDIKKAQNIMYYDIFEEDSKMFSYQFFIYK